MNDRPWDGTANVTRARLRTCRHAGEASDALSDAPATRMATMAAGLRAHGVPDHSASTLILFIGVVSRRGRDDDREARARLQRQAQELRAFEWVEWSRAVTEAWLVAQAYAGRCRSVETHYPPDVLRAKVRAAELAERCLYDYG